MIRRPVTALAALAVAAAGVAVAAPAQAAQCENQSGQAKSCPVAGGTAASSVVIPYSTGSATVALRAAFGDPGNAIREYSVQFTITGPGEPTGRTVYPSAAPTVSGGVKTYAATYTAYNFKKPGTYTVRASAEAYGDGDVTVTTTATTFVVQQQPRLTMSSSKSIVSRGEKVYFYGTLYPTNGATAGQKLKLTFKAKGTKKWKKEGKAVVKSDGSYKTKKQKMVSYGKWRLTFKGSTYLLGAKAGMVYKKS